MPVFIHPTTGKPPSATLGYDFDDFSAATNDQHCGWDVGVAGHNIINICGPTRNIASGFEASLGNFDYELFREKYLIRYLHKLRLSTVAVNTIRPQGALMGNVGATGAADGAHLHFDISCIDKADALALCAEFGGNPLLDVHQRKNGRWYINPAILINNEAGGSAMSSQEYTAVMVEINRIKKFLADTPRFIRFDGKARVWAVVGSYLFHVENPLDFDTQSQEGDPWTVRLIKKGTPEYESFRTSTFISRDVGEFI